MSITDELRQVAAKTEEANGRCGKLYRGDLDRIADRIDAEHEKAAAGCIHYDPERHYCSVHGDTESGWVRLPLDADGVPIHVGDVVESVAEGVRGIVGRIQYWVDMHGDMQARIMAHLLDASGAYWYDREEVRHYRPPTVEDVLREFSCVLMGKQEFDGDVTEAIAEYAAKLRLAEGEDE